MDINGMTEAHQALNNFWPKATEEIKALTQVWQVTSFSGYCL